MASLPLPPPPSAPPPPPPQTIPPPPPPTTQHAEKGSQSSDTERNLQEALLTAATLLEKARCLESEQEANMLMASSLLRHPPGAAGGESSVDASNLPGGIQDAWNVLSDASQPTNTETAASAMNPIEILAKKEQRSELPLGQGRLGAATHMAAMAGCLQREATVRETISKRRPQDGAIMQAAVGTAKSVSDPMLWMKVFDDRLRQIRSYHARHEDRAPKRFKWGNPIADGYDLSSTVAESVTPVKDGGIFDSEEVMGKYLDLKNVYESSVMAIKHILNTEEKSSTPFGLREFLYLLAKGLDTVPENKKLKERKKYVRFLVALETYLRGFLKRTAPLLKLEDVISPSVQEFESEWRETGGAIGFEAKAAEASMVDSSVSSEGIDLSPYSTPVDLEKAVTGDALKAELSRLGLKCGGTPADRAKRLFLTKDTPLDKLPKKVFAKRKVDSNGSNTNGNTTIAKNERRIDIARREAIVMALLNQVRPTLDATSRRLQRRETQTQNEREREMEEDLYGSVIESSKEKKDGDDDDSDSDDDAPIYNPKGVPLGWDGKPIPYWLFKLHGLNNFYPCEICGNEAYRGRRNFETHFAEAKHAFGMKSLGIPNTKHFHGVTKIADAQELWGKLKDTLHSEQFDGSKEEEYEDSHGNVLSRATYEDLARQGLL